MKRLILSVLAVLSFTIFSAGYVSAQTNGTSNGTNGTKGTYTPPTNYDPYMEPSPATLNEIFVELCQMWPGTTMNQLQTLYYYDKLVIKTVNKDEMYDVEAAGFGFACVIIE